jgi:hypothetical protein
MLKTIARVSTSWPLKPASTGMYMGRGTRARAKSFGSVTVDSCR